MLLRKGIYPKEYINDLEKFNETTLPEKDKFYSNLNMEEITDADYMEGKGVYKHFEIKKLGEYNDLYLKIDRLLLTNVFENSTKMCLKSCQFDHVNFLSAAGLTWQVDFKKTEVELELLTDIEMLKMVEKGNRGRICNIIHPYAKANNKYMRDFNKSEESSCLKYWAVNNLYGWLMSQKLPVNKFEWIEKTSQLNKDFIKNYNTESDEGYFFEVDVQYPEKS